MKANRILLITQAAIMYAAQLPIYIAMAWHMFDTELYEKGMTHCVNIFLILSIVLVPICLANIVLSIVSIFKGDNHNPSILVLILKCAVIPWFILNFAFCGVLVLGMLNPFLIWAMPLIVCILVFCTYLCMVTTSLPDVAFFFSKVRKKETRLMPQCIVPIVFMFIFCMDAIGALFFLISSKNL